MQTHMYAAVCGHICMQQYADTYVCSSMQTTTPTLPQQVRLLHICPHTAAYICVCILLHARVSACCCLHMCPQCVLILLHTYVFSYYCIHMCPHAHVSSYYCIHMCPHTYVSSYYCMRVSSYYSLLLARGHGGRQLKASYVGSLRPHTSAGLIH